MAKCSVFVAVEVDTRYGEEFEVDDETFEQVIALLSRHGSTDHCQVPPEVLDHFWVDFAGLVLVAIVAPAWALWPCRCD